MLMYLELINQKQNFEINCIWLIFNKLEIKQDFAKNYKQILTDLLKNEKQLIYEINNFKSRLFTLYRTFFSSTTENVTKRKNNFKTYRTEH